MVDRCGLLPRCTNDRESKTHVPTDRILCNRWTYSQHAAKKQCDYTESNCTDHVSSVSSHTQIPDARPIQLGAIHYVREIRPKTHLFRRTLGNSAREAGRFSCPDAWAIP